MIVDDHVVVRDGFKLLLGLRPEFEIVAEASNAAEALVIIEEIKPDLVLVDINLPGMDGLSMIELGKAKKHKCSYIVLSSFYDQTRINRAVAAGAKAYISKTASRHELYSTILRVWQGEIIKPQLEGDSGALIQLTDAERRVLTEMADGATNEAIARALGVSINTIKSQIAALFRKLDVENRTMAISKAKQMALL